ncbi:MAG: BRCT domain-containing protein [Pseudomonadales bacterium]
MSDNQLSTFVTQCKEAYDLNDPIVSDDMYDHIILPEVKKRLPTHPIFNMVETLSGNVSYGDLITHNTPMLSTDKHYTQDDVTGYVTRVLASATTLGIDHNTIVFSITPKLDGIAANYFNNMIVKRGNGLRGEDITKSIERGIVCHGGANTGPGELVVPLDYFDENLKSHFDMPRGFIAGLIESDTLSQHGKQALQDKAVHFVPFTTLSEKLCHHTELTNHVEEFCKAIENDCIYLTDGCVISVVDKSIRDDMGSNTTFKRWQVAKKVKGQTASVEVESVTLQIGRTGVITPVLNYQTTYLSNANLANATAHHMGNLRDLNVGIGATITVIRSGEVIPTLVAVEKTGEDCIIPTHCPCCNAPAQWETPPLNAKTSWKPKFMYCTGNECSDQLKAQLYYFFHTLGNANGFGYVVISKLVEYGIKDIASIYRLSHAQFTEAGISNKTAKNLFDQLERSRTEAVEDWRWLASFGIHHLGRGDARKILRHYSVGELNTVTSEKILVIDGFGEITSNSIGQAFQNRWLEISGLLSVGFNLTSELPVATDSPITGKNIVFTGSMASNRGEMQERARQLGANVQSTVNKKTNLLVIGDKVGQKKILKATELGTKVLTEEEYLSVIA